LRRARLWLLRGIADGGVKGEVIAKPLGNVARQCAITEKCGSGVRVSGKAGDFAITLLDCVGFLFGGGGGSRTHVQEA